jgi:hypothetical protein
MLKLHHCEAAIMRAAEDTSNSVLPSGVTGNNSLAAFRFLDASMISEYTV